MNMNNKQFDFFSGRLTFIDVSNDDLFNMEMNLGESIFHEIYYNWMRPKSIIDRLKSVGNNIATSEVG